MITISISGADEARKMLTDSARRVRAYTREATLKSLGLVEKSVAKRCFPAKNTNVQDAKKWRYLNQRKPYASNMGSSGQEGYVSIKEHTVKARSNALQRVMRRVGLGQKLERQGLYIDPASWKKGADGKFVGRKKSSYTSSTNRTLLYFRFKDFPGLLAWSQRKDRGFQFYRHSVRINLEAIRIITATPSLNENQEKIRKTYKDAVLRSIQNG